MADPRINRPPRVCKGCGKTFTRKLSQVTRKGCTGEYCSRPCLIAYKASPTYFWSLVTKTETCWIWNGYRSRLGYGSINWSGKKQVASRVSYEWANGTIPEGMFVLHKCDNPPCVNPDHLEIGTPADNSRQMVERNRQTKGTQRHNAKLTPEAVKSIRQEYVRGQTTLESIARKYKVAVPTISTICSRKKWRHVN